MGNSHGVCLYIKREKDETKQSVMIFKLVIILFNSHSCVYRCEIAYWLPWRAAFMTAKMNYWII